MTLTVKDAFAANIPVKTSLDGSDHVPHHNIDTLPASSWAAVIAKLIDYNTDVGVDNIPMVGMALPSATGAVAGGTAANPIVVGDGGGSITVDDGGITISVDDGAGSLTVDGTVTANQGGTWVLGANSGVDIGDVTINNAAGASAVNIQDGGNSITIDGNVGITGAVDTELPAAAALSADNVASPTAPAVGSFGHYFDGTNWDRVRGDSTDGTLVNLGANNDVQGMAAHDSPTSGNPVLAGGQMETPADSAPGTRAGTDGDAVKAAMLDGALFTLEGGPQRWTYHENSSSALTDTTVHAAPGAGLSLYVLSITFSTGAATAWNIFFEEGASTVLGPWYLEAVNGRGATIVFPGGRKITANTALTVTTSAAIAHSIDVTGFIAPG